MSKKALLVTFEITTRVCVPVPDQDDLVAIQLAMQKILTNPQDYVIQDVVTEIIEDTEIPYNSERDD